MVLKLDASRVWATTFSYSVKTACSIILRVSAYRGKAISQWVPSLRFLAGNETESPAGPWMTLSSRTKKQLSKQMIGWALTEAFLVRRILTCVIFMELNCHWLRSLQRHTSVTPMYAEAVKTIARFTSNVCRCLNAKITSSRKQAKVFLYSKP